MTKRLAGKTAVVTAAGQGIGRSIAEAFVAEGATVWATDIDVNKLDGLKRAKRRKLDVLKTKAVETFAEKVGPIDILANVAGVVHHGSVLDCSEADWDFSFDLNVKSMHRMIRAFLPGMRASGGGSIVNLSSAASSGSGTPASSAAVANTSTWQMVSSQRLPALILPGQRAKNGTRCPASQMSALVPR